MAGSTCDASLSRSATRFQKISSGELGQAELVHGVAPEVARLRVRAK
jgi:hypothetical protein